MHDTRLDHVQSLATDVLDAIHGGESMGKLIETFPKAEAAFKSAAAADEPYFFPMLLTFDDNDEPVYTLISSAEDKDDFLIEAFTVLSVMDVRSFVVCIDAYIKLGAIAHQESDMSLEQMHALDVEGVYPCLSTLSFNTKEGLAGRYIPYEATDDGVRILEDKIVGVGNDDFKEMDESFRIVFNGCNNLLNIDIDERISDYWIEFLNNEKASALFFEDTEYTREEAFVAYKELKKIEDGRKYAHYIIEDALLSASRLHILAQPSAVSEMHTAITDHIETQTEIGQWLNQARLTS